MSKFRKVAAVSAAGLSVLTSSACSGGKDNHEVLTVNTTTTVKHNLPPTTSYPFKIPFDPENCAKFSEDLAVGEGRQVFNIAKVATYFVTNLGEFQSRPNDPSYFTEDSVVLKHRDAYDGHDEFMFSHNYDVAELEFSDGTSAVLAAYPNYDGTDHISGWVCEPDFVHDA